MPLLRIARWFRSAAGPEDPIPSEETVFPTLGPPATPEVATRAEGAWRSAAPLHRTGPIASAANPRPAAGLVTGRSPLALDRSLTRNPAPLSIYKPLPLVAAVFAVQRSDVAATPIRWPRAALGAPINTEEDHVRRSNPIEEIESVDAAQHQPIQVVESMPLPEDANPTTVIAAPRPRGLRSAFTQFNRAVQRFRNEDDVATVDTTRRDSALNSAAPVGEDRSSGESIKKALLESATQLLGAPSTTGTRPQYGPPISTIDRQSDRWAPAPPSEPTPVRPASAAGAPSSLSQSQSGVRSVIPVRTPESSGMIGGPTIDRSTQEAPITRAAEQLPAKLDGAKPDHRPPDPDHRPSDKAGARSTTRRRSVAGVADEVVPGDQSTTTPASPSRVDRYSPMAQPSSEAGANVDRMAVESPTPNRDVRSNETRAGVPASAERTSPPPSPVMPQRIEAKSTERDQPVPRVSADAEPDPGASLNLREPRLVIDRRPTEPISPVGVVNRSVGPIPPPPPSSVVLPPLWSPVRPTGQSESPGGGSTQTDPHRSAIRSAGARRVSSPIDRHAPSGSLRRDTEGRGVMPQGAGAEAVPPLASSPRKALPEAPETPSSGRAPVQRAATPPATARAPALDREAAFGSDLGAMVSSRPAQIDRLPFGLDDVVEDLASEAKPLLEHGVSTVGTVGKELLELLNGNGSDENESPNALQRAFARQLRRELLLERERRGLGWR